MTDHQSHTPEAAETYSADPAAEISALKAALTEAEAKVTAAKDAQLRSLAELDNARKRAERDADAAIRKGSEKLLSELLSVCDSLDQGLDAARAPQAQIAGLIEGMELTRKQLLATLEKHGVSQIDPAGQPFNPDLHEAVAVIPSAEMAPNTVAVVQRKGYRLHERLLRSAMVVVSRAVPTA